MKILCVSDQIDPLVYSNSIENRFSDVDLVLSAGDLPADYLDFIASGTKKPLFFVFGNHEGGKEAEKIFQRYGLKHIGSKIMREGGLIVAGLGGSACFQQSPNRNTEFYMYLKIIKLVPKMLYYRLFHGRFADILLTHMPPKYIYDKPDTGSRGVGAFLWFIKTFKPKYLVHGHIHLYDISAVRRTRRMETEVINAYNHYVIDTGEY